MNLLTFARLYLARVAVDDADVRVAQRALEVNLLHVLSLHVEVERAPVRVRDHERELLHVAQDLLADALARAVDADLDAGTREQHCRAEHGDADGLAEAARRRDQDLLRDVVPAVHAQHLLVVSGKLAWGLQLPEAARACLQEVVVEQPLVVAPIPPEFVQLSEVSAAELHVLHRLLLRLPRAEGPCVVPRAGQLHALLQAVLESGHQGPRRSDQRGASGPLPLERGTQQVRDAVKLHHRAHADTRGYTCIIKRDNVLERQTRLICLGCMDAVDDILKLSKGKYSGKTVDEIMKIDPQYVWFLSQRNLTLVQVLRYKKFFDSHLHVVARAKEITEGLEVPTDRQHQTHTPGGWRGW